MHLYAPAYEISRNIGLEIGEAQDQIGFQGENLVQFCARECGNLGFFLACSCRPDGETGDPNDSMILFEKIQCLGGLLSKTDDTLWELCANDPPPAQL